MTKNLQQINKNQHRRTFGLQPRNCFFKIRTDNAVSLSSLYSSNMDYASFRFKDLFSVVRSQMPPKPYLKYAKVIHTEHTDRYTNSMMQVHGKLLHNLISRTQFNYCIVFLNHFIHYKCKNFEYFCKIIRCVQFYYREYSILLFS